MFTKIIVKSGIMVAGLLVSQVVIEKLEKRSLKRNTETEELDSAEKKGDEPVDEVARWAKLRPRVKETLKRHGRL